MYSPIWFLIYASIYVFKFFFFFSINTELPDMNISMMYALLEVASVTFVIKSLHFYILSRLY